LLGQRPIQLAALLGQLLVDDRFRVITDAANAEELHDERKQTDGYCDQRRDYGRVEARRTWGQRKLHNAAAGRGRSKITSQAPIPPQAI